MPTQRLLSSAVLLCLVVAGGHASAQYAILHRDTQFGGGQLHIHADAPRLSRYSFNDSASSITLGSDQPIAVYKDVDYGGSCKTIWGSVARLSDTGFGNDNISSLRIAWTCEGGPYDPNACARAGCGAFRTCTDSPRPAPSGPSGRICGPTTRVNIAPLGVARQSSIGWGGVASRAIDGNFDGNYSANSTSHTAGETNSWFELDLKATKRIDVVAVSNRTDCCGERMIGATVELSSVPCDVTPRVVVASAPQALTNVPLQTREFPGAPAARYVCLRQPGQYLQITELQVFEPIELDACLASPCIAGATCTDKPGVDTSPAGRSCELDACATTPCGANTHCQDLPGEASGAAGRTCTCKDGFAGDPAVACTWITPPPPPPPNRVVNLVVVYDAEAADLLGADPVGALASATAMAGAMLEAVGTATDRVTVTLGGTLSWDRVVPSTMVWPAPSGDGKRDMFRVLDSFRTWSVAQAARLDGLAAGNADAVILVSGKSLNSPAAGVVGSMCTDHARSVVQVPANGDRVKLAAHIARQVGMNLGLQPEPSGWNLMSWWAATSGSARIAVSTNGALAFGWVPGGSFTMGSPTRELGRAADEAERSVTLKQGFWLQDAEVTRAQWVAVMGGAAPAGSCTDDDCPVEGVSFWDVLAFANRLSTVEGLRECYALTGCTGVAGRDLVCQGVYVNGANGSPLACQGYRLPTEAEWEYAYRAGTRTAFYTGGIASSACADPNAKLIGWHCGSGVSGARGVKKLVPNAWGMFDLAGNVAEWTWDLFGTWTNAAVADPLGATTGDKRVMRGGGWSSQANALRAASRAGTLPTTRAPGSGFRLAVSTSVAFPQLTYSAFSRAEMAEWFQATYISVERCLDDVPAPRSTAARCGDGRIEGDEDCDPGIGVDDSCCNTLCDLAPGCACANTDPCCSAGQFTPASAKKVCRAALGVCDVVDTCDGLGSQCPVDAYASPGAACGSGSCYERQCVSGQAECNRYASGATYAVSPNGTPSERFCAELVCQIGGGGGGYIAGPVPDGLSCGAGSVCVDHACVAATTLKVYRWKVGGWSACINAQQTRAVTCVDEAGVSAAATLCDAGAQPAVREDCVADIPPPSPGVSATATLTSSWATGFCMSVKVENRGAGTVTWAVTQTIAAPGALTQVWDAKAKGSSGIVTFTGGRSNKSLKAGASTTFGYCARR